MMASAVSRIDERHEFSQSGSKEVLRRIKVTPRHITQNKEKILNEWRQNSSRDRYMNRNVGLKEGLGSFVLFQEEAET